MAAFPTSPTPVNMPDDPRRHLAAKLTVLARQLWLTFDQRAEKIGLTRAKWSLVAEVANNPGSTQRAIAAKLQVTDVTAGRLIDRLCAEGYLERHEDPGDRRAYRVYPTAPAKPLMDQLQTLANSHALQAFAGFEDEDLTRLAGYLETIARNVGHERAKA
jgi:MarR family transcriptional regulator for hemolysin